MGSDIKPASWSEVKSILRGIVDFADASSEEQSMTLYSAIAVVDAAIEVIKNRTRYPYPITNDFMRLKEAVKRLEGKE